MQRFFTLLHLVYVGLGFSTNKVVLSSGGAAFFLYLFYLNQITMSKRLLLAIISLLLFSSSIYSQQPRIVILATGGTIAGAAPSATGASYRPGVISIENILKSVPDLNKICDLKGIQVCNISSQNITEEIWIQLACKIDSLFSNNLCDGIVITHGTDTMEETAYFLNLVVKHKNPIVLTGSMRPSTSLSADGPFNLFNAVSLAADKAAYGKGVMAIMNDYIFSADDLIKSNTVNPDAFESPNFGPMGMMRGGKPRFYRETLTKNTVETPFEVRKGQKLPKVEILYAYAFASDIPFNALLESGIDGIVIAGVGHGNYNRAFDQKIKEAKQKGIIVVRSSRIFRGGVDNEAEEYDKTIPVSAMKSPQKARILLMLSLMKTNNPDIIQGYFGQF